MIFTREEALDRIRSFLIANTREDETTCQAAARLGIFCRGYDKWSTEHLRQQYPWLAKKLLPEAPREDLLKLIVAWDGARQLVHDAGTTCDAKVLDREACLGFDRFSSGALKRLFPDVFGAEDQIQ